MQTLDPRQARQQAHPVLWLMIAVMIGFELMFAGVDGGLLPEGVGRGPVYWYLAFFDLHLVDGTLYRAMPVGSGGRPMLVPAGPEAAWSFLSYAFLHGGWLHLAFNGAAFMGLGHRLVRDIGIWRFLAVFAVTAVAAAACFALISDTALPMVGASGVLFGLFGMLTAWQERALRHAGLSRAVVWQRIAGLVAVNVMLAAGLGGLLAWEAHLGGWVAGWLMAYVFRPRRNMMQVF